MFASTLTRDYSHLSCPYLHPSSPFFLSVSSPSPSHTLNTLLSPTPDNIFFSKLACRLKVFVKWHCNYDSERTNEMIDDCGTTPPNSTIFSNDIQNQITFFPGWMSCVLILFYTWNPIPDWITFSQEKARSFSIFPFSSSSSSSQKTWNYISSPLVFNLKIQLSLKRGSFLIIKL